jgi:hypothetical protein
VQIQSSVRRAWLVGTVFVGLTLLVSRVNAAPTNGRLETSALRFELAPDTGAYQITDKRAGVTWRSHPQPARFGAAVINGESVTLGRCAVARGTGGIEATFHPLPDQPDAAVRVTVKTIGDDTLEFVWTADAGLAVQSVRLLDGALWVSDADRGYLVVPAREGLLIPADSGIAFEHNFDTYAYEGCHMEMLGVVKAGAAALITWSDPYVLAQVKSTLPAGGATRQVLAPSLVLSHSARSCRVRFLGRGDYVSIGRAYRQVAKQRGWLVTWPEKLKGAHRTGPNSSARWITSSGARWTGA